MMMELYVIFGAADPEAEEAEKLCRYAGVGFGYATTIKAQANGGFMWHERVNGNTAYTAGGVWHEYGVRPLGGRIIAFECGGEALLQQLYCTPIHVDHHRPGDPGYGKPPGWFLLGSSIGQLIEIFAREGRLPSKWRRVDSAAKSEYIRYDGERWLAKDVSWYYGTLWAVIPCSIIRAAAADHCLAAAYRGECPGVDPEALMVWRVRSRAAFQGRRPGEILADIERAREALRRAPRIDLGGEPVADLRGQTIPELPEAAAREGIAFLATPPAKPGERQKVVLQCAGETALAAWPQWAREHGLVDLYGGDPARGFAGGYLPYVSDDATKT